VAKTPSGKTYEQLKDEFKFIKGIKDEISIYKMEHLHKLSWTKLAHNQMLKQAVHGRPGPIAASGPCAI
jgi:hypothetical protein